MNTFRNCRISLIECLLILAILALLSSLGVSLYFQNRASTVTSGTIVSLEHHNARIDTQYVYVFNGDGSFIMIPTFTHYDEDWTVDVIGTNASGVVATRSLSIDRSEFEKLRVGQKWNTGGR